MVAPRGEPIGWDLALARVVLAGVFLFAAYHKLVDPNSFAKAIKAFELVGSEPVMEWLAFIIPWVEAVCGAALLVGFWARGAAFVLFFLLLGFIVGLASVMARGMEIECQCFGDYFGDDVNWVSIARNVLFMAIAAPVAVRGPGMLSIDNAVSNRRARREPSADEGE